MLKKITLWCFSIVFLSLVLVGCSIGRDGKKNSDFEYMKKGNITKVNINSTRDKGFKFVVTDEGAIKDIYDILCSAKPVDEKSSLEPDYVFELYTQEDKVYKFNYIAGIDKADTGNFYSDNKVYKVSKRMDKEILSSFWYIRRPKDFKNVYYNSLLQVLGKYRETVNKTDLIGINLKDDVEVAKFILSKDVENFSKNAKDKSYNANIINGDNSSFGVVMNIKTEGYKTDTYSGTGVYKCTVTFENKKDNSKKTYYVFDNYKDSKWKIKIYDTNKPPAEF